MPRRSALVEFVPFAPLVAGLVVSVFRFRSDDPVGGVALALGGVIVMLAAAIGISKAAQPE